jgi:RNA polymerase sigma-70 factor, ECF subfamily
MLTLATLPNELIAQRHSASKSASKPSDEALMRAIAAGDKHAMQVLYGRHNVRVYRFVLRLIADASLAEDVVSEVFLDVWRRAASFKAKSQVSTWLMAIARHKALSTLRGRSHERLDDCPMTAIVEPSDDAETITDNLDREAIVRKCLSQLSAIHREVLDLAYYHEKSVGEVAEIVGVPVNTVKTRMFYARKRMETMLAPAGITRC